MTSPHATDQGGKTVRTSPPTTLDLKLPARQLSPIPSSQLNGVGRLPRFEGYEVLGELGRGGMGIVYQACQTSLNRLVALKVILGGTFANGELLTRFQREAEAVARLQHPAIVQIFEIGISEGLSGDGLHCPYIALEFVEGGALSKRLGRPQPPRESARLVEVLARAVHYAHEQGIIHRDLKPGNVLMTADGMPKLSDFGLAKFRDGGPDSKTATGVVMGTPEYMPPEQIIANGNIGPAADVYSLGVILYEMITGRRPFEGESELMVFSKVLADTPRAPNRLCSSLPRDLEVICLKCLAKEPHRRYASAAALADDLARFQADEPILARPQGHFERFGHWCKRKPLLAGMTAALVTVVCLGFGGITTLWLIADESGRVAEEKSRLAEHKSLEAGAALINEARARAEGQLQVARFDSVTASQLIDDGDLLASLPWLVEAMRLEERGLADSREEWSQRERIHRVRLAAVLKQCPHPLQIWTHDRPLRAAFFSQDGRQVITATPRGSMRIWDTETGGMIKELPGGSLEPTTVAVTEGGLLAHATGKDEAVCFCNTRTGEEIESLAFPGPVRHVAFSPDGRLLLVALAYEAQLWNLAERKMLWEHRPAQKDLAGIAAIAFSPDGKRVVLAGVGAEPEVRAADSGKLLASLMGVKATVTSLCFARDGRLGTCSAEGARIWDLQAARVLRNLADGAGVWHAAFSPDGRFLATAEGDGIASIWDSTTGNSLVTFRHTERVVRVSFSPDGRRLLTASHDGTARVWDAATGRALLPPLRHTRPLINAVFHPKGDRILTAADDGIARIWDITDTLHPASLLRHTASVRHAAFDRTGDRVATVSQDGTVRMWDIQGEPTSPWMIQSERLTQVGFHPGGRSLITAGCMTEDKDVGDVGVVQTWDLDRSAPGNLRLTVPTGPVKQSRLSTEFSPDGSRILLVGRFAANVWDMTKRTDLVSINQGCYLRHAAFSSDGSRVAAGNEVGIVVWDLAGGKQYKIKNPGVRHVAFSPDGSRIAAADDYHSAGIFAANSGAAITPPLTHNGAVRHVAFSPDSKHLISTSDDRTARIWDSTTGRPILPPLRHRGPVTMAVFSPSGREVLTVCNVAADKGSEGRLRWWDVATGEPLTPFLVHSGEVYHAAISPRGSLTIAACENGAAWLWPELSRVSATDVELQKFAEVLSGQRLDPRLGAVPLTQEVLEAHWRDLRSQYRDQFQKSSERIAAWHRFESEECEAAKQWGAASWHLDRLLTDRPTDWRMIVRRGHVNYSEGLYEKTAERFADAAKLGPAQEVYSAIRDRADQYVAARNWQAARWYLDWLLAKLPDDVTLYVRRAGVCARQGDRAQRLADLTKAVELGAGDSVPAQLATERALEGKWAEASRLLSLARERGHPSTYTHVLACLKTGDLEGYRRLCEANVAEVTVRGGPNDANQAAWLCALCPGALADPGRAVKLAEVALAGSHEAQEVYLNTLGAVLFRAGRHREAIAKLNESVKRTGGGGFEDWVFLGLAHHAIGETEEAKPWFEKAIAVQKPAEGTPIWNRVEHELLRDQVKAVLAESLIK